MRSLKPNWVGPASLPVDSKELYPLSCRIRFHFVDNKEFLQMIRIRYDSDPIPPCPPFPIFPNPCFVCFVYFEDLLLIFRMLREMLRQEGFRKERGQRHGAKRSIP